MIIDLWVDRRRVKVLNGGVVIDLNGGAACPLRDYGQTCVSGAE